MKLHEKITEVFETDLGLELNEEELIATQETLRKIGDAAHELDKKTNEIGNYYYAECYEHKLTKADLHNILELLEKHRLNCKDFDELVLKYKGYYEQGDDLRINYATISRYEHKSYHHWSDVFKDDLLKGKKKHLLVQADNDLHEKFPLIGMREKLQASRNNRGHECRAIKDAADLCKKYSKKTSFKELMNFGN